MQRIPFIIFIVAIVVTIPTVIILHETNANGEEINIQIGGNFSEVDPEPDPEPTDCNMGMSSVDNLLCKKLDKILENQEVLFENQEKIFDLISFWQEYISGIRK